MTPWYLKFGALRWGSLALLVISSIRSPRSWSNRALTCSIRCRCCRSSNSRLLYNTGAAFSFLADASGWQRWFFIVLGVLVSAAISRLAASLDPRRQSLLAAGLALILGGALGNVIDRVWLGHVIDFIHFHWKRW